MTIELLSLTAGSLIAYTLMLKKAKGLLSLRGLRTNIKLALVALVVILVASIPMLWDTWETRQQRIMGQTVMQAFTEWQPNAQLTTVRPLTGVWVVQYLNEEQAQTALKIGKDWLIVNP